ncbi:MAG: 1-acyl-sn-glycerol-3-phosphate acyltransferase [Ruminococcaceae bacterium]|nr:1-acyl-sn-glycerol-3-phosphate acyltransferase [Oscillospiraceae bacterium]
MAKNKKKKTGSRAYRIIYAIFAGIVGVIFNYKIVNPEKEPDACRCIVCANHVSATDAIALCYAFRKNQVCFMAKKELFKIPVLAPLIRLLGAFPIDRGGNDVGAIKNAVSLVTDGKVLGIFPQGHRYPGEDPRKTRTKNGMALIATKAQANIVPAYIWRKKNRFKLFRRTYIILGDMIPFESLGYDPEASGEYARITNTVFDEICNIGEEFERERAAKKAKKAKKS